MNTLRLALGLAAALSAASLAPAQAADRTATVSFGAWMNASSTPLDRLTTGFAPSQMIRTMTPNVVRIKAGGTVNFIVSGAHNIAVYDDGTLPSDINVANTIIVPGLPPLINDATNRTYRGVAPNPPTFDRVEVVHFPEPGTFLVICTLVPHFAMGMYGYVEVVP